MLVSISILSMDSFNTTLVRLKDLWLCYMKKLCYSFNTTLVRLKDFLKNRLIVAKPMFQYHPGAIKRPDIVYESG